jgi:hypothetical protein
MLKRAYLSGLQVIALAAATSCARQKSPEVVALPAAAATSSIRETGEPPPLDLEAVAGYELHLAAITGKPIGTEKARVTRISDWSLNSRGQLALRAEKSTPSSYVPADLFRIDNAQPVFLLSQRPEGPHSERRINGFEGCLITDGGQVLVARRISDEAPSAPQLWFVDEQRLSPVPSSEHFQPVYDGNRHGRLAFVSWKRWGPLKQRILAGDGKQVRPCVSADSDPSEPARQFRAFGRIWSINARGQIVFEAAIGRDPFDDHRLFLFSPPESPAGKTDASTESFLPGTVREIARHGARLPGTKLTLADTHGHDVWKDIQLSDRGDVLMYAELDESHRSENAECLFVLRPESEAWLPLARPGQPWGEPPQMIQYVSPGAINVRGQVACVVAAGVDRTGPRLVRVEPDDELTIVASFGDQVASGEKIRSLSQPRILAGGQIVFQAGLKSSDAAIAVADEKQIRLVALESDWPASVAGFSSPRLQEFQASDSGHVAFLIGDAVFEFALLLATPRSAPTPNPAE